MGINDRKIVTTILAECATIDQRCPGYREAIVDLIGDILRIERQHKVTATQVRKKVNDAFNITGQWLAGRRPTP